MVFYIHVAKCNAAMTLRVNNHDRKQIFFYERDNTHVKA